MPYGLEVFDAGGVKTLSYDSRITRLIDSRIINGGSNSNYSISGDFTDLSSSDFMAFSFCLEANKMGHTVSISGVSDTEVDVAVSTASTTVSGETIPNGNSLIITIGW